MSPPNSICRCCRAPSRSGAANSRRSGAATTPIRSRDYLTQIATQVETLESELREERLRGESRPPRGSRSSRPHRRVAGRAAAPAERRLRRSCRSGSQRDADGRRRGQQLVAEARAEADAIMEEARAEADAVRVDAQAAPRRRGRRAPRRSSGRARRPTGCSAGLAQRREAISSRCTRCSRGCSPSRRISTSAIEDGGARTPRPTPATQSAPRRRARRRRRGPSARRRRAEDAAGRRRAAAEDLVGRDEPSSTDVAPTSPTSADSTSTSTTRPRPRLSDRAGSRRPGTIVACWTLEARLQEIEAAYEQIAGQDGRARGGGRPRQAAHARQGATRSSARSSGHTASIRAVRAQTRPRRASSPTAEPDAEMAAYLARRPSGSRPSAPSAPRRSSRRCWCRRIRTRARTSSSRSARAPAARRPRCGRGTCSRCTGVSPSGTGGRPRSCPRRPSDLGGFKEVSLEIRAKDAYAG